MDTVIGPFEKWVQRVCLEVLKDAAVLDDGVKEGLVLSVLDAKLGLQPACFNVVGSDIQLVGDRHTSIRKKNINGFGGVDIDKRCLDA